MICPYCKSEMVTDNKRDGYYWCSTKGCIHWQYSKLKPSLTKKKVIKENDILL